MLGSYLDAEVSSNILPQSKMKPLLRREDDATLSVWPEHQSWMPLRRPIAPLWLKRPQRDGREAMREDD